MIIKVTNSETEMEIYFGDAEEYLDLENDSELEEALNRLDYTSVKSVIWENLLIEKELELIYD